MAYSDMRYDIKMEVLIVSLSYIPYTHHIRSAHTPYGVYCIPWVEVAILSTAVVEIRMHAPHLDTR